MDNTRLVLALMRFFATFLITNAHIEGLYPAGWKILSTGGALGNSLFFFCSGFALYLSNRQIGFFPWLVRRITRIYPSLWLFMLITLLMGVRTYSFWDIIIPVFWFLQAILLFYILFYFTMRYLEKYLWQTVFFFAILFFITYLSLNHRQWIIEDIDGNSFLHWYFYYMIMLVGAIIAKFKQFREKTYKLKFLLMIVFFILIFYYGVKVNILHTNTPIYNLQLLLPVFLGYFSLSVFYLCKYLIAKINTKMLSVVSFVSNLTLDIYIIQFVVIEYWGYYTFPIGFLGAIISIPLIAYILYKLSGYVTTCLRIILLDKE